jgi:lysophospholipase L1-like esterase
LPEFTRRLQAMAADEGADFLDLFNVMGTYVGYIGVDGLHPTPTGYQRIAELWLEEIQRHYEVTGDTPAALSTGRRRESR